VRRAVALYLILQALIAISLLAACIRAETGSMEVVDVYWGESGKSWAAMPGDEAPLTVVIRSLEDKPVCGLKAILAPTSPYENLPLTTAKTWGNAIVAYMGQQIGFGSEAEITFDVKIREDAKPGVYSAYLYLFYYDCESKELTQQVQKIDIRIWPPPDFDVIDVSWRDAGGRTVYAGPGEAGRTLRVTLLVPRYYEISTISATMYLDEHFSNLTGGKEVRASFMGTVGEGGYFTLEFPLNVNPTTEPGIYVLKLLLKYYSKWLARHLQEIDIPVAVSGAGSLSLSAETRTLTIGSPSQVIINVTNTGYASVYSLRLTASSDALVILDEEMEVGELKASRSLSYSISIWVPPTLSEGVYPIYLQAQYVDSNGVEQTLSKTIKLYVRSQPGLTVSGSIVDPEVAVGESRELKILIRNNYDLPVRDVVVKIDLKNTPLAASSGGSTYFAEIPGKGSAEMSIHVMAPPSASPGLYYAAITITYRNPYGSLTMDEASLPVLVKPDLKLDFSGLTFSSTSVIPGEYIDISGDILNKGLSTAKLCEVRVEASPPIIISADSRDYIGDISSLSKASFTVTIGVASNARPGKYSGRIIASCTDAFGNNYQRVEDFEIEVARHLTPPPTGVWNLTQTPPTQGPGFRTRVAATTSENYLEMLQRPTAILTIMLIVAVIVVSVLLVARRARKRVGKGEGA